MLYLNFDGLNISEIYSISEKRIGEIADKLSGITEEIISSIDQYEWQKDGDGGIHKGKILKRFLRDITDFQEKITVLILAEKLVQIIHARVMIEKITS